MCRLRCDPPVAESSQPAIYFKSKDLTAAELMGSLLEP